MNIRSSLLAVLLLATSGSLFGAVTVKLGVEPAHVLPGIPASLLVSITNDSSEDAALPSKLLLRVIPASGAPFIAEWGAGQENRFRNAALPGEHGKVAGNSTVNFAFRSYALDRGPGWFYDARLDVPGQYRLQLLLVDDFRESAVFKAPPLYVESAVSVRYKSSEAVLTIDTPRGDDAELWADLQRIAQRHNALAWSPIYWGDLGWREFVAKAVEKFPSSGYAPFVVRDYAERPSGERIPPEERLSKAQRVLDAHPDTPVRDDIRLFLAEMQVSAAQSAAAGPHPDLKAATDLYGRARSAFEVLARTANDPSIRERSTAALERLADTPTLQ